MKSPTKLAQRLLKDDEDGLEELRIHEFADDEAAHDDDQTEELYAEFATDFETARTELSKKFGEPKRIGTEEDEAIPLNGVLHFAVWEIDGKLLYVAASHEDREVPILLMIGTSYAD